ncbi:MAG TPA: hypothetical protein VMY99_04915 [Nevskiaceae bacterium]|nr:hypothetical protein [Nevskiaceae bacterium]
MNEQKSPLGVIAMPETSMLVTNEILVRQGVGRYGVAAELLDMAVTGKLRIYSPAGAIAIGKIPDVALEYVATDPPQADKNQMSLLQIVFDKTPEAGDSITFEELSERKDFVPRIDELQTNIRKSLSMGSGSERYYGMDPVRFNKLRTPARWIGGLAFLALYLASNKAADFEMPFAQIGGWVGGLLVTAAAYFGVFGELDEKLGMQSRARDIALPKLQSINEDVSARLSKTLIAPASPTEKNIYANNAAVRLSYQRALALTIPLGWHDEWLHHFCKVSNERPAWFVTAKEGQDLELFRADMHHFIDRFEAVCYPTS